MDQTKNGRMEKIVEIISCKMYKVLINGKIEEKHIDQIKKAKRLKTVIPRMNSNTLNNSPGKRYPTRKRKPLLKYGFEDK